ncbi:hypothetical protein BHM03_00012440 [Ensete ventricosum]|nr:hypothetical protein BHM03_00012440 [Ensete ventricosum]
MPIKVRLEAIDVRSPALAAWVLFAPFPLPSSPSISHRVARNLSQFAKSSSPGLVPTQRFDLQSSSPVFPFVSVAPKSSVSMDIPESQWTEDEFCAVGTETDRVPSYKSSAASGVKAGISSGIYMAFLRFLGEDSEARNFSYSLEVGGNGRKLIWQGVPRSIRDNHRKVRDSYDGLIIHRNMALFFSGGDRQELKLRVTGRIWKEQ